MRIALAGPGRAGQAVAIAANGAGHDIAAVVARNAEQAIAVARRFDAIPLGIGEPIPPVDLVIIAVRDGAIETVAGRIAPIARNAAAAAIHLSGAVPVAALSSFADHGVDVGSFHPLQTLPTPTLGARRLAGSSIAVTAIEPLRSTLHEFARSMGCHPFDLDDADRAAYHAAAAAAANFPIAALVIAQRLFESVGVPLDAARPLAEAVVANAFDAGPLTSLTGPVARGDSETVAAQIAAVREAAPDLAAAFEAMVDATAVVAGLSLKESAQ
ncbi:MAG TPA: DUF2520 domain-containing protein [Acidimicrobiia bacterium]|nr:DUF2520 domain-containing protein [Acidimicrobiia bacterium]